MTSPPMVPRPVAVPGGPPGPAAESARIEPPPPAGPLPTALAPVARALVAGARRDAEAALAAADNAAARVLAEARDEADRIRAQARADGAAEARAAQAVEQARAGRRARGVVLRAERDAYDGLVAAAGPAVAVWRDQPGYDELLRRLTAAIRATLGPDARISEAPGGGLIGEVSGRRVDHSLRRLAEAAVDTVLAEWNQP
ncbi:MAG TPA: hypothetical protein VF163_14225 [Micromonosporaceae bacterium]